MENKTSSWFTVILMNIIFFPVGFYLLAKKMAGERMKYVRNGKTMRGLGIGWFVMGILCMIMALTGNLVSEEGDATSTIVIALVFFFGSGVILFLVGNGYKKRGERIQKYLSIIKAGELSVENIASAMQVPYEKAVDEIQQILDIGYFPTAYIDARSKRLTTPEMMAAEKAAREESLLRQAAAPKQNVEININTTSSTIFGADMMKDFFGEEKPEKEKKPRTVRCSSCGAITKLEPDAEEVCAYCGSPI